jgi:carbonic anhydrase
MSTTDALLQNAEHYAATFDKGDLPLPPGRKIAVLACMDARLNPYGLQEGDAHVIRNAGGVVTDDEIRSLAISQRLLGTEEIILIHHTDCGMLTFTDDEFKRSVQDDIGIKPAWAAEAFPDLDEDVRQSIARIKASPFIPHKDSVRGFVYDVHTGALHEVDAATASNGGLGSRFAGALRFGLDRAARS